ncbi:hypothetical protein J6U76_08995 [bacterium]|nr:hypothetical protein [bacterium]
MKHLFLLLAAAASLAAMSVMADEEVIWSEDFSTYTAGDLMSAHSNEWATTGPHYIVDDNGNKCVRFYAPDGESLKGLSFIKVPDTTPYCGRYYIRFSCKLKLFKESQVMHGFRTPEDYFMFDMINKHGDGYGVDCDRSYGSLLFTDGRFPHDEWAEYSFLMEITPSSYRLKNMVVNGVTNDFDIAVKTSGSGSIGSRLFFGGWGNPDFYLDDFKLTKVLKEGEPVTSAVVNGNLDLDTDETTITIVNKGGGSFNYTATIANGYDFASLEDAEGTCEGSATVKFKVDRSAMASQYYHVPVTINGGEAGSVTVYVGVASGLVLMNCDFECYEEGKRLPDQDTLWQSNGPHYVIEDEGSKCMRFYAPEGTTLYNITYNSIPDTTPYTTNYYVKFSCRMKVIEEAQVMHGIRNYFMFDAINKLGNAYVVDCHRFYVTEMKLTTGYFPNGRWTDYSFVMDITPGSYRLRSMTINGVTDDFNLPKGEESGQGSIGNAIYFGGWNNPDIYIDDIQLELVEKEAKPELDVEFNGNIGLEENESSITIINRGGGTLNYNVTLGDDYAWASLEGAEGSCQGSAEVKLVLDRAEMGEEYYRGTIHVEGGEAGSADLNFGVASGHVLYGNDFEMYTVGEPIVTQDGAWTGNEANLIETDVSQHLRLTEYTLNMTVPDTTAYANKYLLRFNCRAKANSFDAQICHGFRNGFMIDAIDKFGDGNYVVDLNRMNGSFMQLTSGSFPMGEWCDYGFLLDLRTGVVAMKSIWINGVTNDFDQAAQNQDGMKLGDFYIYGWGLPDFCIDDMEITLVDRSAYPEPILPSCVPLSYRDSYEATVINNGGGSARTTVTVLDYTDFVTVTKPAGDLVTTEKLTFNVSREGLQDGFFYARYRYAFEGIDSEITGAVTGLVSFAVGGWYYGTDFQAPYFEEGELNGQPGWSGTEGIVIEKINGENCLTFPANATASLAASVPNQAAFTLQGRVLAEAAEKSAYVRIGTIDGWGYRPVYLVKDNQSQTINICCVNDDNEFDVLLSTPFSDEWTDFSFTMDTDINVGAVIKVTLGEEEKEVSYTTDPDYDWTAIDQFSFTTYTYDEGSSINQAVAADGAQTGLHIARLIIHDPAVPEPAVALFLLALGALFLRRK